MKIGIRFQMKIGIATPQQQLERALAIASGTRTREADEPTVWFPSISAVARIFSDDNMALLKIIREKHPESIDALAEAVGKHAQNVSRSLQAMEPYGVGQACEKRSHRQACGDVRARNGGIDIGSVPESRIDA